MTFGTKLAVVAIGGNSLIRDRNHESIPDQYATAVVTVHQITNMIEFGWNVIITHGNGPQLGFVLRRAELAIHELPPVPMDYAGADLQGALGYMLVKAFRNEFRRRGLQREPVALVTEVLVDRADPAFANPTKPIGSQMERAEAEALAATHGWQVREDAGRGWRRVVPSPRPLKIIDYFAIDQLIHAGFVVVCCGGGGVPVVENGNGSLVGVEAVIDKDLASSLLARSIGADLFMLSTGVERVALDFNKPGQHWLDRVTLAEACRYYAAGQFEEGTMAPKIKALIEFLEAGGKWGLVTDPVNITDALARKSGTLFVQE